MRFSFRWRCAALVLPLVATWVCGVAQAAVNIVPVEVRQLYSGDASNHLFVDVTVCNAKQQCRTVPNVLVDTGSPGLRLHRQALGGLSLDEVTILDQRPLGKWSHFGSGDLWSRVHWAQVRIGGVETTQAIPIELFDDPSPDEILPAGYGSVDLRGQRDRIPGNGILGISPRHHARTGYFVFEAPWGATSNGRWDRVFVGEAVQVVNPIVHFPAPYDNGSVISLPEVDWRAGQDSAQGWLGFGIGLPTEMLFPHGRRVISHELDASGQFPGKLGQHQVDLMLDSGTNLLRLDLEHFGFARHGRFKDYYDPATLTPIDLSVVSAAHEIKLAQPLHIGPADSLRKTLQGYGVLPMLAIGPEMPNGQEPRNVLGLPFFFGRTVATGLRGAVNPYIQPPPMPAPTLAAEESFEVIEDYVDHAPARATAPAHGAAWYAESDGFELVTHSPHGFVAYTD